MKKLTYVIALCAFLLAGCSQDEAIVENKGELVTLNYKVSLGKDIQSRNTTGDDASSEGNSSEGTTTEGTTPSLAVNKLLCVVYESGKDAEVFREIVDVDNNGNAKFEPQLFTTIDYRIVFWAYYDSAEDGADFFDLTNFPQIKVSENYYTTSSEPVYKDAFTFAEDVNLSEGKGGNAVTLTRPFTQVTLLTSVEDYVTVSNEDDDHLYTPEKCKLEITSCLSVYDAKTGTWRSGDDISVTSAISTEETKTIDGVDYYYLANEYIFAGNGNVKCTITVLSADDTTIYSNSVENVPLSANKSTNMYNENLLVGNVTYNITIGQGAFDDDSNKDI